MLPEPPYTRIFLEDVLVEAHVGFAPWEKYPEKMVPLLVTVELFSEQSHWPDTRLGQLMDYTHIYRHLMALSEKPHVESLEELCDQLLNFCFEDVRVSSCRVKLKKPHVVFNASGLGVEIFRHRPAASN